MATDFDVAIIGAGVGGCCAALALRKAGLSVALLEAGTVGRHKVCGEFLSPESRHTFARLGVLEAILNTGAHDVTSARVLTSRRAGRAMPLPEPGIAISRQRLDTVLWERAQQAGVQVSEHTRVSLIQRSELGYCLHSNNAELSARFVVAATGRNARLPIEGNPLTASPSPKTRFMGIKTHLKNANCPTGEVQLFPFRGGYCGMAQVEDGTFNACALVAYDESKGHSPDELWQLMREQNSALAYATSNATPEFNWIATANVSFEHLHPAKDGLLCVGDAAGYIHPLTGDGMAMAARAGELAAQAITSSPDEATRYYQLLWQQEFSRRLRIASLLQPLLINPMFTKPAQALFDFAPALAQRAVKATRGY